LQDCIRDVGEGGGRINNDLAILEEKFKEAELKLIKTDETEKDSKKP
jgi:hypothetical protein